MTTSISHLGARSRRLGYWVLGLAAALFLGLLAFSLFWSPPAPVQARVRVVDGQDILELRCSNCSDGSTASLAKHAASFTNGLALLPLDSPLRPGLNKLQIALERGGVARDEKLTLQVPVDYRLAWDLSGLAATPPTIAVQVHAAFGVQLMLNGSAVQLHDGRGQHVISIGEETQGVNASVEWITKEVRPTATGGRAPDSREPLTVRVPVVPLTIETPWDGFGTDSTTVIVSGRSAPGAKITVAQHTTEADATGYFEVTLLAEELGTHRHVVEARAHEQAPRFATVAFERVQDLKKTAIEFQKGAVRRFDKLQRAIESGAGEDVVRVALSGRVQEWQHQGNTTVMLLGVTYGCPQRVCVVRVAHPSRLEVDRTTRLSVFGTATQVLAGPAPHGGLPQIQSHFVLMR